MINKIILEGSIQEFEYTTKADNSVFVKGSLLSFNSANTDTNKKLIIYFYIEGLLAKKYYKKLFKNTRVIFEGKLELTQWKDSNDIQRARYSINVQNIKLFDSQYDNKKFNIIYSRENNSFIV